MKIYLIRGDCIEDAEQISFHADGSLMVFYEEPSKPMDFFEPYQVERITP